MLLYGANVFFAEAIEYNKGKVGEWLYALNREMDTACKSEDFLFRAVEVKKNKLEVVILVKNYLADEKLLKTDIAEVITHSVQESIIQKVTLREITSSHCSLLLKKYSNRHGNRDIISEKMQEVLPDNSVFPFRSGVEFWEEVIAVPKRTNFLAKAKKIKADAMLTEEMERIYSDRHPKQYRGIPAHYKISATSEKNAKEIVDVLLQGLYANNRILSKRVTYIKLKSLYEYMDCTIDKIFTLGAGGCVVLDMFDNPSLQIGSLWGNNTDDEWDSFDSNVGEEKDSDDWDFEWLQPSSGETVKSLAAKVEKNAPDTLLVILENAKHTENSGRLVSALKGKVNLIEIKEGLNGALAQQLYYSMVVNAGLLEFSNNEEMFVENRYYSEEDVATKFRTFSQECMTDKIYTEYSKEKNVKEKVEKAEKSSREELQRLIGLNEVKQIVGNIIAVHKVNKMRNSYSEETIPLSKHMLFSGNPGTAKTTVARLMAQVMKEEGLLKTGKFVECGRSDLVGQYVGWTAVQVKKMFRKAKGGVLFIDEAYSLVDDSNSFGDEAINTIVAEMENMRDEVIVIFAGYPDKMKAFLDKNEGLRSRIAYHIDFPDYTPNELLKILEKLAEDRAFMLNENAKEKAFNIFCKVYGTEEMGNGRFVRNLLEQAIFRQAARIMSIPEEDICKEQLFELTEEDFTYENAPFVESNIKKIGFAV